MHLESIEFKCPIQYFEIPLNLIYKYDFSGPSIFVNVGPYIGIGLSGKVKTADEEVDIEFGSDDDELKRVDTGVNF